MTTEQASVADVRRALMMAHDKRNRTATVVTGKGSRPQRRHMPTAWRDDCGLAGEDGQRLHSLYILCCKAEKLTWVVPTPITEHRMRSVRAYLEDQELEAEHRLANFETMLRRLSTEAKARILGEDDHSWLYRTRSPRSLNAPEGTFPLLEADLARWASGACRPLITKFEERRPIRPQVARQYARYMLCAANLLLTQGHIAEDVRLAILTSLDSFNLWNELAEGGSESSRVATIYVYARVRQDLFGSRDAAAHEMAGVARGLRDHRALPMEALQELEAMLAREREIDLLPFAFMEMASEAVLPAPVRLKLSNLAPALRAGQALALRPGEIFVLKHDEQYRIPLESGQPSGLTCLLRQRAAVRRCIGAVPQPHVMSSKSGSPLNNQACDQALARTLAKFGLPAFPWQRLRDFAAMRILLKGRNPDTLATVADLLGFTDVEQVSLRYHALIPRESPADASVPARGEREGGLS